MQGNPKIRFVPTMIGKIKNELGTTNCNATIEAAANYAHRYARYLDDIPRVDPSVLITISGTYFHVFGEVTSLLPSSENASEPSLENALEIAHFIDSLINPIDTSCPSESILQQMSTVLFGLRKLVVSLLKTYENPYAFDPYCFDQLTEPLNRIAEKLIWFSVEKLRNVELLLSFLRSNSSQEAGS
jgi:hypothetical protein